MIGGERCKDRGYTLGVRKVSTRASEGMKKGLWIQAVGFNGYKGTKIGVLKGLRERSIQNISRSGASDQCGDHVIPYTQPAYKDWHIRDANHRAATPDKKVSTISMIRFNILSWFVK